MRGAHRARGHGEHAGERDREQRGPKRPATQQAQDEEPDDADDGRTARGQLDDPQDVTHRAPLPASKR